MLIKDYYVSNTINLIILWSYGVARLAYRSVTAKTRIQIPLGPPKLKCLSGGIGRHVGFRFRCL